MNLSLANVEQLVRGQGLRMVFEKIRRLEIVSKYEVNPVRKLRWCFKPHHRYLFFTPPKRQGFLSNGVNRAVFFLRLQNNQNHEILPGQNLAMHNTSYNQTLI